MFSQLRKRNYVSSGYLDDTYLQGASFAECEANVKATATLLRSLGFTINTEKSITTPSQQLCHLGFILNSDSMSINLSTDKIEKVKLMTQRFLRDKAFTIRSVAQLIGVLVSCFPGMAYGPLYYRYLERDKSLALKRSRGDFEACMSLSIEARTELRWWLDNAGMCPTLLRRGNPDFTIQTDASNRGWGARLIGGNHTGGRWSETELGEHINILELRASFLGLKSLGRGFNNCHIQLQIDNTTAVSYVQHMGGSHSEDANSVAHKLWLWAISRNIWLSCTHIPGCFNVVADKESRTFNDNIEWKLNTRAFHYCVELWGQPEIDLFASRLNHQFTPYVSWRPDPEAMAIDAFSLNWSNKFLYIFCPFSVISRVLDKLQADNARAIMIVPQWPTQTWYPVLSRLSTDEPLTLPVSKTLLTLPGQPDKIHPLYQKLRLTAYHLSGKNLPQKV